MVIPLGRPRLAGSWMWFGVWAVATAGCVGLAVEVGWIALVPTLVVVGILVSSARRRQGVFGILTGLGASALVIPLVHRHNPNLCWMTQTEAGCDQTLDWHLWLPIGVFLGGAGPDRTLAA
jgi:hypothetical protein